MRKLLPGWQRKYLQDKNLTLSKLNIIADNKCNWKHEICLSYGRKHSERRRKCLVSAFSPFSQINFKRLLPQGLPKMPLCGKGFTIERIANWLTMKIYANDILNPLPHNATFWHTKDTQLWKTLWEKEKLHVTSNFSFTHNVFYPTGYFFLYFAP